MKATKIAGHVGIVDGRSENRDEEATIIAEHAEIVARRYEIRLLGREISNNNS